MPWKTPSLGGCGVGVSNFVVVQGRGGGDHETVRPRDSHRKRCSRHRRSHRDQGSNLPADSRGNFLFGSLTCNATTGQHRPWHGPGDPFIPKNANPFKKGPFYTCQRGQCHFCFLNDMAVTRGETRQLEHPAELRCSWAQLGGASCQAPAGRGCWIADPSRTRRTRHPSPL